MPLWMNQINAIRAFCNCDLITRLRHNMYLSITGYMRVNIALLTPFIDRAVGVRMDVPADDWFAAFGLFGESVSGNAVDDEGWGGAGRFVHAPVQEDDRIVHVGVRGAWRKPMSSTKSVRIRDETTNMSNFRVVDTGLISDVDNTRLVGAEFAVVEGGELIEHR